MAILDNYMFRHLLAIFTHIEITPDDGQWNCPKHVEFYSKNKFEKLVHPVGFIIRIRIVLGLPDLSSWTASPLKMELIVGKGIWSNTTVSVWIRKPTRCHFLYSLFLF